MKAHEALAQTISARISKEKLIHIYKLIGENADKGLRSITLTGIFPEVV